ncbi:MAG: 16S rRNA (cytidine(1402)-2'-O)-methyltransferase [Patescibacteria group bacterium]
MLYIVATPIGNLDDITMRALNILKSVSCILCEDTRHTQTLLNHYGIKNRLISYHQHSNIVKIDEIINKLKNNEDLALVTDAGTPCISDPGFVLINKIREELPDVKIFPIPGASAVISALSVSGFNLSSFTFLGFIPNKNGREKFIKHICDNSDSVFCFYESCYRIEKLLDQIEKIFIDKDQKDRKIFIARELTKMFESYYYGTVKEVREKMLQDPVKGEFVVVINKF